MTILTSQLDYGYREHYTPPASPTPASHSQKTSPPSPPFATGIFATYAAQSTHTAPSSSSHPRFATGIFATDSSSTTNTTPSSSSITADWPCDIEFCGSNLPPIVTKVIGK